MIAQIVSPDGPRLVDVLSLIQRSCAFMDGRVDPPSSALKLDREMVARQSATGDIPMLGEPIVACVFFERIGRSFVLGETGGDPDIRRRGFSRQLAQHSIQCAGALDLRRVLLKSRVELGENHAAFRAMGFDRIAETSHPGFERPTSPTFARSVAARHLP